MSGDERDTIWAISLMEFLRGSWVFSLMKFRGSSVFRVYDLGPRITWDVVDTENSAMLLYTVVPQFPR